MNPAKRRRLDATTSTLSKPFRSPIKLTTACQAPSTQAEQNLTDIQEPRSPQDTTPTSPKSTAEQTSGSVDTYSALTNDVTALQRQHAALTQHLRKLKQDLDTAEQALKLQSNDQEAKLNIAIRTWRNIARDAADEVFENASNRVRDMGGMQAWQKQSSQDRHADQYGAREERHSSETADGVGLDKTGRYCTEGEQDRMADKEGTLNDGEEQQFTMDLMLRQMNIDPNLLGFDKTNDQWVID